MNKLLGTNREYLGSQGVQTSSYSYVDTLGDWICL